MITKKSYQIMSKDIIVGEYSDGKYKAIDALREPLFLKTTGDFERWLSERCLDTSRAHSRLLVRITNTSSLSPAEISLKVNAAKITDTYWVREKGSSLTYEEVLFHTDELAMTALHGNSDGFKYRKGDTPELTNTGSYEKCWLKKNSGWCLLKKENPREAFSEIFTSEFARNLGFRSVQYAYDEKNSSVVSKDFTNEGNLCLEEAAGIIGEDHDDFEKNYQVFSEMRPGFAEEYQRLLFIDAVCMNYDRHSYNYGVMRDPDSGEIISMAPNYDNNLSLYTNPACDRGECLPAFVKDYADFFERHPFKAPAMQEIMTAAEKAYDTAYAEIPEQLLDFADKEKVMSFITSGAKQLVI